MLLHQEISNKIIKACYAVYHTLGYCFLERTYENAMLLELLEIGLNVQRERPIRVFYKDQLVGEYLTDVVVEDVIINKLKAAENLCEAHECQLINFLKATEKEIGLLLNFGKKLQFKRKIYTNK